MLSTYIDGKNYPLTEPAGYHVQLHSHPRSHLHGRNGTTSEYNGSLLSRCVICGQVTCPDCSSSRDMDGRLLWAHYGRFQLANGNSVERQCMYIFHKLVGAKDGCSHTDHVLLRCQICDQHCCTGCANQEYGIWAHAGGDNLCWRFRDAACGDPRFLPAEDGVMFPVSPKTAAAPAVAVAKSVFKNPLMYCENAPPPELFARCRVQLSAPDAGKPVLVPLVAYHKQRYAYERHLELGGKVLTQNLAIEPCTAPLQDLFGNLISATYGLGCRCALCGGWIRLMGSYATKLV